MSLSGNDFRAHVAPRRRHLPAVCVLAAGASGPAQQDDRNRGGLRMPEFLEINSPKTEDFRQFP
ncbi:hypothetical protein [Mycobacterium simiae]|uniref:hypothetical protein n=1 Tax=Mycobacterium simiae TaxID=1784 RepID=UPI00261CADE0|nr:hypothetical protein [Mycobacterium simiae]